MIPRRHPSLAVRRCAALVFEDIVADVARYGSTGGSIVSSTHPRVADLLYLPRPPERKDQSRHVLAGATFPARAEGLNFSEIESNEKEKGT